MGILKKKIELGLCILCLYLVYSFAIALTTEPEVAEQPDMVIDVTAHIDAYDTKTNSFKKRELESKAQREAQKMLKTGDLDQYEEQLRQSGMLNW